MNKKKTYDLSKDKDYLDKVKKSIIELHSQLQVKRVYYDLRSKDGSFNTHEEIEVLDSFIELTDLMLGQLKNHPETATIIERELQLMETVQSYALPTSDQLKTFTVQTLYAGPPEEAPIKIA